MAFPPCVRSLIAWHIADESLLDVVSMSRIAQAPKYPSVQPAYSVCLRCTCRVTDIRCAILCSDYDAMPATLDTKAVAAAPMAHADIQKASAAAATAAAKAARKGGGKRKAGGR